MAFIYLGQLVEFGETASLFANSANVLTEKYITGKFG
jgi:ABC-type phosphate transport system ATPase subunit